MSKLLLVDVIMGIGNPAWYNRTMAMTLSPEVERLVEARLQRGDFASADDIIRAAMAALDEREEYALDEDTLDAIDEAERQADAGQGRRWEKVREELRAQFPCPRAEGVA